MNLSDRGNLILFAIVLLLLSHLVVKYWNGTLVQVKSTVDQKSYWVQNLPDKQQAANLIATTLQKFQKVLAQAEQSSDHSFQQLVKRYTPSSIQENFSTSSYTSYSENKGQKIVLCLRSKDSAETLIDENTLMFVFLHEMAHLMTDDTGHTENFWHNFKKLLEVAVQEQIYMPVDYAKHPVPFCGIDITDNPLFDSK